MNKKLEGLIGAILGIGTLFGIAFIGLGIYTLVSIKDKVPNENRILIVGFVVSGIGILVGMKFEEYFSKKTIKT